jgi:hypothetical protein
VQVTGLDQLIGIWIHRGIQVAFNDVARSITGARRRDQVRIEDLLAQAGLESANRMVVKAIAAETWRPQPRWQAPLYGQEDGHGKDYPVGKEVWSKSP